MRDVARLVVPALRWDRAHGFRYLDGLIDDALELGVGGFIVEGGPREVAAELIGRLHAESAAPILVAAPAERGAGEAFDGLTLLPPWGAVASAAVVPIDGSAVPGLDVDLVRRAARLTALELRNVGANWALAPVCDLDAPRGATSAGARGPSADPAIAAAVVGEWVDACQADAVAACAAHFPHAELGPLSGAVDAGVASMLVRLSALGAPRALERLRGELGFDGIAATERFDREPSVTAASEPAVAVAAIASGCDVVMAPHDVSGVVDALEQAAARRELPPARIAQARERFDRRAGWARPTSGREPGMDDLLWARQLADRTLHWVRGARPRIGGRAEVVAIGADAAPLADTFRAAHLEVAESPAPVRGERAPLVVVLGVGGVLHGDLTTGEIEAARAAAKAGVDGGRDVAVVACCHPRGAGTLAAAVHGSAAILCAWDASRPMLEAAARAMVTVR